MRWSIRIVGHFFLLPFTFRVLLLLLEYCLLLWGSRRKIRICRPCRQGVLRVSRGSRQVGPLCIQLGRILLFLPVHILGNSRCKSGRSSIFRRSIGDTISLPVVRSLCIFRGRSRRICRIRCSDPGVGDVSLCSLSPRPVVVLEILRYMICGRGVVARSSRMSKSPRLL